MRIEVSFLSKEGDLLAIGLAVKYVRELWRQLIEIYELDLMATGLLNAITFIYY